MHERIERWSCDEEGCTAQAEGPRPKGWGWAYGKLRVEHHCPDHQRPSDHLLGCSGYRNKKPCGGCVPPPT